MPFYMYCKLFEIKPMLKHVAHKINRNENIFNFLFRAYVFDNSPVPCVISFTFLGDLQNYTFLERLGPTEPEK